MAQNYAVTSNGKTAMMMRTNFEISGYKQMNVNEIGVPDAALRRGRRKPDRPSWTAAALGVVCVAAMFGMLGLLYAL